uniref:Na+/H+ antiporter n=1 Tax=Gordonia sp. B7-2 TaxID=3420932 RepID=UPI003D8C1E4F
MSPELLLVAVAAVPIAALCRRYGLSAPLVLVTVGLAVGWIPGMPEVMLEPDLVLFLILPPLLYSAAQDSSYQAIRANRRAIGLLAVGLPLFTTLVVGLVAYWTVPNLPLAAALVLGAVVAPPDAVSAQAIGRRLGLPRRIMTLLGGESLLNDATALTAFRIAVVAVGATASLAEGLAMFALAAVGGVVIGLVIGFAVSWLRTWLDDPPMETAIGIMVSFATYFAAEEAHASGVIAVVTAGLFLGSRSVRAGYATRLQDEAVRKSIDAILEAFVFLLIGLQMPFLIEGLSGESWVQVSIDAAAVLAATILIRFVWVYPATYLPRLFSAKIRAREGIPPPGWVFVVAWSGMRGVVSLAAAFAIPLTVEQTGEDFPGRPEILFLTFVVVIGTLLIQGTTLPWVIRRLGVSTDDESADRLAYAAAQDRASREAEQVLDGYAADIGDDDPRRLQVMMLRKWVTTQRNSAWEELGRGPETIGESPTAAGARMRLDVLKVQRSVFIDEHAAGRIGDEVLRMALRQLDFAEAQVDREA